MGSVYLGEHHLLGHQVAIKVARPDYLDNIAAERRFLVEARSIASVHHPSIVELFDFGRRHDGHAYIVMELLRGQSLHERLQDGPIAETRAIHLALQIASALAVAHDNNIIHRDLKPSNIFLVADNEHQLGERAKIIDFGIAKRLHGNTPGPEITLTGMVIGTPSYMSPEQCRDTSTIDARSDIYSFGALLYHTVTGCPPFSDKPTEEILADHLYAASPSAVTINPTVSSRLSELIQRCLAKDPALRFQTMHDVADTLASMSEHTLGLATERMPQLATERMPQLATERMLQETTERMPQLATERMPQLVTEHMLQETIERMLQETTERTPRHMNSRRPEHTSKRMPKHTLAGSPDRAALPIVVDRPDSNVAVEPDEDLAPNPAWITRSMELLATTPWGPRNQPVPTPPELAWPTRQASPTYGTLSPQRARWRWPVLTVVAVAAIAVLTAMVSAH